MLEYSTQVSINLPYEKLNEMVLNPDIFLKSNEYIYAISKTSSNIYDIVFIMKKMGITKKFSVNISVTRIRDMIIYQSTEQSKVSMKLAFTIKKIDQKKASISAEARADAGVLGNLFGKYEFKEFIDKLLNYIASDGEEIQWKEEDPGLNITKAACHLCAFFDPKKLFCYAGFIHIKDVENPACKGEKFSPYSSK